MRILIHAANLQKGGALQVAASLFQEFAQSDHQFHILAAPPLIDATRTQLADERFTITTVQRSPTHGLGAWRTFLHTAQSVEKSWRPDVALTVFGPGLWRPGVPHLMGFANGLYLFSDSRFIREDWPVGKLARMRYALRRRVLLRRVAKEADAWWVETETARLALARAAKIPEESIAVVPNALGPAFLPFSEQPLAAPARLAGKNAFRVLVMGAAYPNKNLSLVAAMLPQLRDVAVEFHFTLPQEEFQHIFGAFAGDTRLKNLGSLTPGEAPSAYTGAGAVLLPSKLETFSAVLLEAAAMQKPLLAPDLPFAREVCGDSALYFDPWNPASAASALRIVMRDTCVRQQLIRAGCERIQSAPTAAYRARRILDELTALVQK